MNKKLIPLTVLFLIKNSLWGGIEYYNTATKANAYQKAIEQLEIELFPKVICEKYNFFTNPLNNFQIRIIKTQALSKRLTINECLENYNHYIFEKLLSNIPQKDLQLFRTDPCIHIIKNSLLPYSSFYFCKLLGNKIESCKDVFFQTLENSKKQTPNIDAIIAVFLTYLNHYPELNVFRYTLNNLINKHNSYNIDFHQPSQFLFNLWEIFVVNVLNTLKKHNPNIYIEFVIFYTEHKKNGLLLTWEAFWANYKEDIKLLKNLIKKESDNITQSFYETLNTMPTYTGIGPNLQELFQRIFKTLNQGFKDKQNKINCILNTFMDSNHFSIINALFDNNILPYHAEVYLVHQITPIYPTKINHICHCILLSTMRSLAIGAGEHFENLMLSYSNEETKYGVAKIKEEEQKLIAKQKEAQIKKEAMEQFLAEKKEQAAQQKQQPKIKKTKTLSDLDIIFGIDKSENDLVASFQKITITAEEYKSLREQACSIGNVMQHGSHATMRMTVENENGEKKQIQVQGYKRHGKSLKKSGKGKKNYAILEQKKKGAK